MKVIYAIYKENILPVLGGVNPQGIETGIAEYNDWKLCVMKEEEFNRFSEFKLYPIPKSIAVGMKLMNKASEKPQHDDLIDDTPSHIEDDIITEEEKELVKLAKEFLDKLELKIITRAVIRRFKDFEDDLADTKLLIEFLIMLMVEDYKQKSKKEKEAHPMKDLLENFIPKFDELDLRIKDEKFLNKIENIIKDESFIRDIVKVEYVEKIKNLKDGE